MVTTSTRFRRNGHQRSNSGQARGRPTHPTNITLETGLSLWNGTVQEEYLTALRPWSRAFKIYSEMVDDSIIGGMLEAVKTPMLASRFQVVAASESDEDRKLAETLRDDIFHLQDIEWFLHAEEMLEFLEYGWAVAEPRLTKKPDGLLHIDALVTIGQETLDHWGRVDELGMVDSFNQRTDKGSFRSAPMSKLLHFRFRGRKRNPEGKSLLRNLYRAWYFKKNLEALEAIGVERDVGNAPVVKLKEGVRYTDEQITNLKNALKGFRMDEALYVILPPGADLTAYGGGNKVYDVRSIIRDYQHIIRQRFFADFLALGSEQVGTQALAREMTTFFGLALRSIQERMLSTWNRQLVTWWASWNNLQPISHNLPRIDWLRPGDQNLQALAQAYQMLVASNLITPTEQDENRIRIISGMPELEPGERARLQKEQQQKAASQLQLPSGPANNNPSQSSEGPGQLVFQLD